MLKFGPWLGLLFLLTPAIAAQESRPLTNGDVVGLIKAGLSPTVINAKITSTTSSFDTSPAALQELKAAGVPDDVVVTMLQASTAPSPAPAARTRVKDEMSSHFQRLQNSVLTVWSETSHGTGFIVDARGLIVTNHHVVGPSKYIAVQFDERHKIAAVLLEADPSRDVAVLWADTSVFPMAIAAPLAATFPAVEEGERVFTIGSPLNQRKILTSGIASKLEARAILSDVNINPGNSGGPLFNSLGEVVGITTFGDPTSRGPGISGIVRLEEALPLIEKARATMADRQLPPGDWLPVEPSEPFPLETIKAARAEKLDVKPYVFGAGDYEMGILTPVFLHRADEGEREAAKSKQKRTKQTDEAFDPSANLYNWAEYAGYYRAVVTVRAKPKLRETFWSSLGRGLAAAGGAYYLGPANMKFKTDFLRMDLFCGQTLVAPIQPGKIAHVIDVRNPYIKATDATYEGLYTYPIEAFSPECGGTTLKVYSEKKPGDPTVKMLESKTVARVWADFEGWRQRTTAPSAKSIASEPSNPVTGPTTESVPSTSSSPEVHPQQTPSPRVSTTPNARMRVLTQPTGADVYIGELLVGKTMPEGLLLELPAGTVTVSVKAGGYLTVERTVTVDPKNDVVLPITLRANPQH